MGVLSSGCLVAPNFQRPLAAKLCIRPPKVFEVQERALGSLSPCQVCLGSDFTRRRSGQNVEVFCLSVCLSVTLLNVRDFFARFRHEGVGVQKHNFDAMPLDRGRFVVEHACSTLSDCDQLATTLNVKVQKKRQTLGFFANRGRQNKPIETKFGR